MHEFCIDNIILTTDSYKASHYLQMPAGTEYCFCYIESRGGEHDRVVFFGLQAFLKKYLTRRITQRNIEEAAEFYGLHGEPFNRAGWEYILHAHDGRLPVLIKAVPEGMVIGTHNVLATIVNTDPKCFWLPGVLESALLRAIWYPTTVATNSFHAKLTIQQALAISSDAPDEQLAYKLHDFSPRGCSSQETAIIGGMAHLVNFSGTDNVEGCLGARMFYGEAMAGTSIPAAEHSTITAWGRQHETAAYRNMLKQFARPGSIVAIVSDSYDLMNAVSNLWGGTLKQEVIDSGATIVVRPDSGDPLTVPIAVVAALGERFGYTVNAKGFKVLPACVRVIQGDGITQRSLPVILRNLLAAGWSADNLAFGMGGGLLQMVNRDDQRFAMKLSAISTKGVWTDVYKAPVTDPTKRSKRGRLRLAPSGEPGRYVTLPLVGNDDPDVLQVAYLDGKLVNETTFGQVRHHAHEAFIQIARSR